jgi:HPr kinase/phosphorylase
MADIYTLQLKTLVEEFNLRVEFASTDFDTIPLTVADVGRPGLLLAGFFEHFDARRLQVLGRVEMSYLSQMSQQKQEEIFDRLFAYKIPALLICRGLQPYPACVAMAQKHNVTLLTSQEATSEIQSALIAYMCDELAPRITRHGVLMEIYGEGVLVTGESGMGKSEAAVELLKRGHRLIADDAVEIRKISGNTLVGSSPEVIRNYVELRGIGIINVAKLFGVGAVKDENEINMVVNIEPWNTQASYDRLGMEINYTELLGVKVPMHTIPITPGRNLAVILEVAAMNNRQRKMGYNAALELTEQINRSFDANMGND